MQRSCGRVLLIFREHHETATQSRGLAFDLCRDAFIGRISGDGPDGASRPTVTRRDRIRQRRPRRPGGEHKTVAAALASVKDASAKKRYAILVAAGTYNESRIQMKPYVDLYGGFAPGDWKTRDVYQHADDPGCAEEGAGRDRRRRRPARRVRHHRRRAEGPRRRHRLRRRLADDRQQHHRRQPHASSRRSAKGWASRSPTRARASPCSRARGPMSPTT